MSTALTALGPDPFKEYVQAYDANSMGMKRIKFSKGFWNKIDIGSDPVEIKRGTRANALVGELMHGRTKWEGGRPVDHRIGRVADGFVPPRRSELGDDDEAAWETDKDGKPVDPWSFATHLPLELDGETYIFSTSSWGGQKAIRNLVDAYARRADRNTVPVVELDVAQRKHAKYGMIAEPLLDVVGWAKSGSEEQAPAQIEHKPEQPPLVAGYPSDYAGVKGRVSNKPKKVAPSTSAELDDEIPF